MQLAVAILGAIARLRAQLAKKASHVFLKCFHTHDGSSLGQGRHSYQKTPPKDIVLVVSSSCFYESTRMRQRRGRGKRGVRDVGQEQEMKRDERQKFTRIISGDDKTQQDAS